MTIFIWCHPSTLLKGSDKILFIIIPNLNRNICNLSAAGAQQLLCMLDPYFIQTGYHAHTVSLLKFSAQIILIHVKQLCVFRLIEGLVVVDFQIAADLSENIAGSTDVMKIRSQLYQNLPAPAGCMFCLKMVSFVEETAGSQG